MPKRACGQRAWVVVSRRGPATHLRRSIRWTEDPTPAGYLHHSRQLAPPDWGAFYSTADSWPGRQAVQRAEGRALCGPSAFFNHTHELRRHRA
jgi:hypothetical protein